MITLVAVGGALALALAGYPEGATASSKTAPSTLAFNNTITVPQPLCGEALARGALKTCTTVVHATATVTTTKYATNAPYVTYCNYIRSNFPFGNILGASLVTLHVDGGWCWNYSITWPNGSPSCPHDIPPGFQFITTWCGQNAGWTPNFQLGVNGCFAGAFPPASYLDHDNMWARIYFNNRGGWSLGDGANFGWGAC
ncbi:MAG: hypothetical protein ACRENL_05870 [Candidatus Dormibacteria bacterium]